MRGAFSLLYSVVIFVIVLLIILSASTVRLSDEEIEAPSQEAIKANLGMEREFMSSIILSSGDYTSSTSFKNFLSGADGDICNRLQECIVYSITKGRPCKVAEISFGTASTIGDFYGFGKSTNPIIGTECDFDKDIFDDLGGGVSQRVCYLKTPGEVSDTHYQNELYEANGLSINNCVLVTENLAKDGSTEITENVDFDDPYVYVVKDRFSRDGENTRIAPGSLILTVGSGGIDSNENCEYNFYICPQAALVGSEEDPLLRVYNLINTLEIYPDEVNSEIPYYGVEIDTGDDSKTYKFTFLVDIASETESERDIRQIVDSIKTGFSENMRKFNDGSYNAEQYWYEARHWGISREPVLDNNCWADDFDNDIKTAGSKSIYFDCGSDGKCDSQIKIVGVVRQDYEEGALSLDSMYEDIKDIFNLNIDNKKSLIKDVIESYETSDMELSELKDVVDDMDDEDFTYLDVKMRINNAVHGSDNIRPFLFEKDYLSTIVTFCEV